MSGLIAKSYSFGDVRLMVDGIRIGGFGEDGGVTFEPITPERTTTVIGADGEVTAVQTKDRRYKMTIRLMETSTDNTLLAGFQAAQELAQGLLKKASYFLAVMCLDINTGEQITAAQCIFQGPPTMTKDQNPSVREWVAILPNAIYTPAIL